jgi:hypothetical protein
MSIVAEPVTVLTPVYLDRPERLDYLNTTFGSFYRCCRYPGILLHHLVDDRSPLYSTELNRVCLTFGVNQLPPIEASSRRGYFEAYSRLLASVATPFFLFLEPDHYFYMQRDFLSPMLRLFDMAPDLVGLYLRAPLTYERFQVESHRGERVLTTYDGALLRRVPIDSENTGWLGRGLKHEGFTLMPTLWRTKPMRDYFFRTGFWIDANTPLDLELAVDRDWKGTRITGYLNAQAFCYHIGAIGGLSGGYLSPGDTRYEHVWSKALL